MRSTKYRTHLILEPMRITCMLNALIDDGKSYMMSIISRQISTKRTDALYSACFACTFPRVKVSRIRFLNVPSTPAMGKAG